MIKFPLRASIREPVEIKFTVVAYRDKFPVIKGLPLRIGAFVNVTIPLVIVISTPERLRLSILFKSIALKIPVPET